MTPANAVTLALTMPALYLCSMLAPMSAISKRFLIKEPLLFSRAQHTSRGGFAAIDRAEHLATRPNHGTRPKLREWFCAYCQGSGHGGATAHRMRAVRSTFCPKSSKASPMAAPPWKQVLCADYDCGAKLAVPTACPIPESTSELVTATTSFLQYTANQYALMASSIACTHSGVPRVLASVRICRFLRASC